MKSLIKLGVVGDPGVGKTSLLLVYKDRKFEEEYTPQILNPYSTAISYNHKVYNILFQDGSRFDSPEALPEMFNDTDIFIVCFAINAEKSEKNVREKWIPGLKKKFPKSDFVIAATKSDLSGNKADRGHESIVNNSAKLNENIDGTVARALEIYTRGKMNNNCVLF